MLDRLAAQRQRAVIFDLWDTLTEPSAQRDRDRYTREVGELLGVRGEAFAALVVDTFPRRCRGELGDLPATLLALCRELGADPTPAMLDAAAEHRIAAQVRLLQFRPDAARVVERFRRAGWRIGLLTDSTCETEALWQGLELRRLFDAVAFSCTEGRAKPDPLFYDVLVRRLGVPPADCVYVADGRSGELAAAAALGMRCVQLTGDPAPAGIEDWRGERAPTLTDVADVVLAAH